MFGRKNPTKKKRMSYYTHRALFNCGPFKVPHGISVTVDLVITTSALRGSLGQKKLFVNGPWGVPHRQVKFVGWNIRCIDGIPGRDPLTANLGLRWCFWGVHRRPGRVSYIREGRESSVTNYYAVLRS